MTLGSSGLYQLVLNQLSEPLDLNQLVLWAQSVDSPTPVSIAGQTSGTASLYQILNGTIKKVIIQLANYRINANQVLVLPTPFTGRGFIWVGETQSGHISLFSGGTGGTQINIKVITGLGGGGGTQNTQSWIQQWSMGQIEGAWETIRFESSAQTTAVNGVIVIEGF